MLLRHVVHLLWLFPFLIQTLTIRAFEGDVQDHVCDNFQTCDVKGLKYWNKLFTTITQPKIVDRTDGQDIFQQHYIAKPVMYENNPAFRQDFVNYGINNDHFDQWTIDSIDQYTGHANGDDSYTNAINTVDGVLIAIANWKDDDTAEVQLPWSELMYNLWKLSQHEQDDLHSKDPSEPPSGPLSTIRVIIRHTVTNVMTQNVLRTAYTANGYSMNQGDITWRYWSEETTRYFFYAILGTPNVRGTLWLLNDHAAEIGGKIPKHIYTRWNKENPDIW
ncbi:MAG: hypothetical protein Q9212_006007 [Teloschistes hypoglaucus]